MTEAQVEQYLTAKVERLGGWAIKLPSIFVKGLPDRLCLMPAGRIAFVEVKKPGEKAKLAQRSVHRRLTSLGFAVYVADCPAQVDEIIQSLC